MKKRFLLAGLFAISALMTACSDDERTDIQAVPNPLPSVDQPAVSGKVQITFHGVADADNSTSKTVIAEGTGSSKKVNFVSGDQISVYDGTSWNTFSTTGEGESADFIGDALSVDTYYMVYPASDGYTMTDGKISATIPASQQAVLGSFDPKANVSVAKCANGEDFQLKNVCSLLRLVIPAGAEYDRIIVKSNSGDNKIAGDVSVDPETGVAAITDGVSEIELTPEAGGKISQGEYYVAMIPQTLTTGITVELYKGDEVYAKLYKKELSFVRSKGLNATMKDFDYIVFDFNGVEFKMIRVPGYDGGDFYIGETEVTQALYAEVMKGTDFPTNPSDPIYGIGDNYPVSRVYYDDELHNGFLKNLNTVTGKSFRLPSSAEWEYAAKGGDPDAKYSGCNDDEDLNDYAWYIGSIGSVYGCREVATKKANGYGLYDMSGNVWEWCEDLEYSFVLRGGSWDFDNEGCEVSLALAPYLYAYFARSIGFRLALSL